MDKEINKLKEILAYDAMCYPLKYERDVHSARVFIKEVLDIMIILGNNQQHIIIERLRKIHKEFDNYYKLNKRKKNYANEFEEKKVKAKELIEIYIKKKGNN